MVRISSYNQNIQQLMYEHQKKRDAAREKFLKAQTGIWFAGNTVWRNQLRMDQLQGELTSKQQEMQQSLNYLANRMTDNITNAQASLVSFMSRLNSEKYSLEIQLAEQICTLDIATAELESKMNNKAAQMLQPVDEHLQATVKSIDESIKHTNTQIKACKSSSLQKKLLTKKAILKEKGGQYKILAHRAHKAVMQKDNSTALNSLAPIASSMVLAASGLIPLAGMVTPPLDAYYLSTKNEQVGTNSPQNQQEKDSKIFFAGKSVPAIPSQAKKQPDIPCQTDTQTLIAQETQSKLDTYKQTANVLQQYVQSLKLSYQNDLIREIIPDNDPIIDKLSKEIDDFVREIEQMEETRRKLEQQVIDLIGKKSEYDQIKSKLTTWNKASRQMSNASQAAIDNLTRVVGFTLEGYQTKSSEMTDKIKHQKELAQKQQKEQKKSKHHINTFKGQIKKETRSNKSIEQKANRIKRKIDLIVRQTDHKAFDPPSFSGKKPVILRNQNNENKANLFFKVHIKQIKKTLEQLPNNIPGTDMSTIKTALKARLSKLSINDTSGYVSFTGQAINKSSLLIPGNLNTLNPLK